MITPGLPCDDLSHLSREDLLIVQAWVQDRMINAVTPLDGRLQLERQCPGVMRSDATYRAGEHCVAKVLAAVRELDGVVRRASS